MHLAESIKKRRIELGLSTSQLAEYLGVTRQTIENWESGKKKPSIDRLPFLAVELNCTLDELFEKDLEDVRGAKESVIPPGVKAGLETFRQALTAVEEKVTLDAEEGGKNNE